MHPPPALSSGVDPDLNLDWNGSDDSEAGVFAIDFALSRLRHHDETDEEWRRAKENEDEEGAIGQVLHHSLRLSTLKDHCLPLPHAGLNIDGGRTNESVDGDGDGDEDGDEDDHWDLWSYKPSWRWYRELDEEEQVLYETDPGWGLYRSEIHAGIY